MAKRTGTRPATLDDTTVNDDGQTVNIGDPIDDTTDTLAADVPADILEPAPDAPATPAPVAPTEADFEFCDVPTSARAVTAAPNPFLTVVGKLAALMNPATGRSTQAVNYAAPTEQVPAIKRQLHAAGKAVKPVPVTVMVATIDDKRDDGKTLLKFWTVTAQKRTRKPATTPIVTTIDVSDETPTDA